MSRRREQRLERNFEVKVWGMDRHGKPFMQYAHTLDITRSGARLIGVECVNVGEVIGIQNGDRKSRFKVVWIGRENTPKAGQIGVHCLEQDKSIFLTQPQDMAAEADFFHALDPAFQSVKSARPVKKDMAAVRRKHPRYPCTGGMELRQQENGPPAWGNISDISLTGCYVETVSTLPVGSMLVFHLRTHNLEMKGRAVVKASHHTVGMGIAFLHLSQEDQQNLEFLIGMLAGIQEMRPEEKRTFVPADATPEPVQPPPLSKPTPQQAGTLSAQIVYAMTLLAELEQQFIKDKIDVRLITQFHDAMDHTRQTARTVQHWIDLRSEGNDPFSVLPQIETERMNMLARLARNVLADIDSGGLAEFSQGIGELYAAVQQLHRRLARIFTDVAEDEEDGRTFTART